MQIPSNLLLLAQHSPVIARVLLKNKELDPHAHANMDVTFFSNSRLQSPDFEAIYDNIEQDTHAIVLKKCVSSPGNTEIDSYVAINPIGSSNDSIMVYRAAWILTRICESDRNRDSQTFVWKTSVALKVVDSPESILKLRKEVTRTLAVQGIHPNLLRIKTYFMDEQSRKFCVVMPFSHGSLRTIMKNGFPQGFPEDVILSALRSILNALGFLHKQHILHRDINAGHVYLCNPCELYYHSSQINLGYAATVYEDETGNTVASHSSCLPMDSMSNWAAAPEVYKGNQPYSEKADVWLVGITALELAYGGLKVANRDALEAMIKEILDKKKLPCKNYHNKKGIIEKGEEKEVAVEKDKKVNKLKYYVQKLVPFWSSSNDSSFSETFTEMVTECLAWDPKKRPSVDMLLSHQFFDKWLCPNDGQYLYDAVMDETSRK